MARPVGPWQTEEVLSTKAPRRSARATAFRIASVEAEERPYRSGLRAAFRMRAASARASSQDASSP